MNQPNDWFEQSEYDYETAMCMSRGERYIYAVFMCHLAIEKALKGIVFKTTGLQPPRTHSLIQLTKKSELNPPKDIGQFLVSLDQSSIPTRYPENLATVKKIYSKEKTEEILLNTKETLTWLRKML